MNTEYLQGKLYHMISITNLPGIFAHRAILSKAYLEQQDIAYTSIANDEVQQLRDRVFIWDTLSRKFLPLHSYVPFYFATHTPMLYIQFSNYRQESIVILEVSRSILMIPGALFTDGNASTQKLSKFGKEVVEIMPATVENTNCRRRYRPRNIRLRTNASCSNFYSDTILLDKLDWSIINDRDFQGAERTRIKHAEVLIPDRVPLSRIEGISVSNRALVREVDKLMQSYGLANIIPQANYRAELFF